MSAYRDAAGATEAPCVLICAGLDPSGGAGLIADVRVVTMLGGRPVGAITASTVQNTTGVIGGAPMDPEIFGDQLAFLLSDVEVRAVKVGMIGSTPIAQAIAEAMQLTHAPLVWDPVMYPSRGDLPMAASVFADALALFRGHLALLTPNAAELAHFAGREPVDLADAVTAAGELTRAIGAAVLVKGGHYGGAHATEAIDVLVRAGEEPRWFRGKRIVDGEQVHGTGCALSSAIATELARGAELPAAVEAAKQFVADRIASPANPGRGARAIV
jgi:hydroxymethylpyrimidine kinase/phosphomethylpyrimidine kinase